MVESLDTIMGQLRAFSAPDGYDEKLAERALHDQQHNIGMPLLICATQEQQHELEQRLAEFNPKPGKGRRNNVMQYTIGSAKMTYAQFTHPDVGFEEYADSNGLLLIVPPGNPPGGKLNQETAVALALAGSSVYDILKAQRIIVSTADRSAEFVPDSIPSQASQLVSYTEYKTSHKGTILEDNFRKVETYSVTAQGYYAAQRFLCEASKVLCDPSMFTQKNVEVTARVLGVFPNRAKASTDVAYRKIVTEVYRLQGVALPHSLHPSGM